MEVPACTAEMFKVRLGIPHVLPKVGIGLGTLIVVWLALTI